MRILIADTETTGLEPTAQICELAFLEVDEDMHVLYEFESLVKPSVPITPGASAVNGITDDMVADAPTIFDILTQHAPGYFDNVSLCAHNASFDRRMLSPHWGITRAVCTYQLARRVWPRAPSHKLENLRTWLDLDVPHGAHRAMVDTIAVYELLSRILEETNQSLGGVGR